MQRQRREAIGDRHGLAVGCDDELVADALEARPVRRPDRPWGLRRMSVRELPVEEARQRGAERLSSLLLVVDDVSGAFDHLDLDVG
jgi:hypothetical protein